MTNKKVFVTGAAGQTGLHTVQWLKQHGQNVEVWCGIHKGQEARQESVLKTYNVHCVVTEATDSSTLVPNFRDVSDLFIIPPSTEDKVASACNYIDAARQAKVKFVLLLSVQGAERQDYLWGRQFQQIENHLTKTLDRDSWCILRAPFYMQNLLLYKKQIKRGELPLPISEGKFAPLDVNDVAVAAGAIMNNCAPHKGKTYELTGDSAMSGHEMATVFSQTIGRPITYKDIPNQLAREILKEEGVPENEIQGLLDFYEIVSKKEISGVTEHFKNITGQSPRSLFAFLTAHKSELV